METTFEFRKIGNAEIETIKRIFTDVFSAEPWNDDWSDGNQLHLYLTDLLGQKNSLTYGLFEAGNLIAVSMGRIKHWYSGTEYSIDELFVQAGKQNKGIGTYFLKEIENEIKKIGIVHIFLHTENNVPAYDFYQKNGFRELKTDVSFVKRV